MLWLYLFCLSVFYDLAGFRPSLRQTQNIYRLRKKTGDLFLHMALVPVTELQARVWRLLAPAQHGIRNHARLCLQPFTIMIAPNGLIPKAESIALQNLNHYLLKLA